MTAAPLPRRLSQWGRPLRQCPGPGGHSEPFPGQWRTLPRPARPLVAPAPLRLRWSPLPRTLPRLSPCIFNGHRLYTAPAACASPHSRFAPEPAHRLCLWSSSAARRGEGSRTQPALAGLSKLGGKQRSPSLAMARLLAPGACCPRSLRHAGWHPAHRAAYCTATARTPLPRFGRSGDHPYAIAPAQGDSLVHIRGSGVPRPGRPGCPGAIPDSGVGLPRSARTCPGLCARWRSLAPVGPDCPDSFSCAMALQTAQTVPYATAPGCPTHCWALAGQCGALWRQPPSRENDYVQNRSCRSQPPEYIHEGSRAAEWASERGPVLRLTAGRLGHLWALRNRRPGAGLVRRGAHWAGRRGSLHGNGATAAAVALHLYICVRVPLGGATTDLRYVKPG